MSRLLSQIANLKETIADHPSTHNGGRFNKPAQVRASWICNGSLSWVLTQVWHADKAERKQAQKIAWRVIDQVDDELDQENLSDEEKMTLQVTRSVAFIIEDKVCQRDQI